MNLVLTTITAEEAQNLAGQLVHSQAAACVSLSEVRSVYRWKGQIEEEKEVLLTCKVGAGTTAALVSKIRSLHPYETPEILVIPVNTELSYGPYVEWVRENSSSDA